MLDIPVEESRISKDSSLSLNQILQIDREQFKIDFLIIFMIFSFHYLLFLSCFLLPNRKIPNSLRIPKNGSIVDGRYYVSVHGIYSYTDHFCYYVTFVNSLMNLNKSDTVSYHISIRNYRNMKEVFSESFFKSNVSVFQREKLLYCSTLVNFDQSEMIIHFYNIPKSVKHVHIRTNKQLDIPIYQFIRLLYSVIAIFLLYKYQRLAKNRSNEHTFVVRNIKYLLIFNFAHIVSNESYITQVINTIFYSLLLSVLWDYIFKMLSESNSQITNFYAFFMFFIEILRKTPSIIPYSKYQLFNNVINVLLYIEICFRFLFVCGTVVYCIIIRVPSKAYHVTIYGIISIFVVLNDCVLNLDSIIMLDYSNVFRSSFINALTVIIVYLNWPISVHRKNVLHQLQTIQ